MCENALQIVNDCQKDGVIMVIIIQPNRLWYFKGLETNLENETTFYSHRSEKGPLAMCSIVKGEHILKHLQKCDGVLIDLVS